ncbi:WD40 repeat-like protein [Myriangium duriaei CBS 260.36]|uniref:WD40 repeat-like protein n=1 Tax=Myriangium duriaei CBS 260.36 TaxID=1168546 RepID=A0A9P4MI77_9PEZI|nr:WD40 repeat-like protein [Myriangium duriaei CBS 260.36]
MAPSITERDRQDGIDESGALVHSRSSGHASTSPPFNSNPYPRGHSQTLTGHATNDSRLQSYSTAGQFAFAPATQQTTVVTTTTTTVNLAPFVLQPPQTLQSRDPKQFPLVASRTPAHLRSIKFKLGGRLTSFTEKEDAEDFLGKYQKQQRSLRHAGGSLVDLDEALDIKEQPAGTEDVIRGESQHGLRARVHGARPEPPPSLAAAARMAEMRRKLGKRNSTPQMEQDSNKGTGERRLLASALEPEDLSPSPSDTESGPSTGFQSTRLSRVQDGPRDSPDRPVSTTTRTAGNQRRAAAATRRMTRLETEQSAPPAGILAAATPPIMDSDVEAEIPTTTTQPPHSSLPSALDVNSQQDASLPSPSLSPVTAAANMAQRQFLSRRRQGENDDVSDLSGLDAEPRFRKRKTPPLFDAKTALTLTDGSSLSSDHSLDRPQQTLMDVPDMILMFDSLPEELQGYVMFQLLKRSSKKTLRTVAEVVNPALKCDPFDTLPVELSLKITKFLDGPSLCQAASVSKRWRHMINSDETAWRELLDHEGYKLPDGEIERAVKEGWGWQFAGPGESEQDLSPEKLAELAELADNPEVNTQQVVQGSVSDDETLSTPRNTRKRKATAVAGSSKRLKQKGSAPSSATSTAPPADEVRWMRALQKGQGPIAYASAAARAVPDPKIGLPSLKSLHLFKSIYRRNRLIRETWMNGQCQPQHIAFRAHHRHVVTCLLFDADRIITGSDDTSINVFDTKTGALRARLEGHEGGVWALAADGNTLVSGSTDRSVRVWNIKTGKCMQTFQGHTSTVRCLVILKPVETGKDEDGNPIMHPKEPIIITGSRDSTLRVWRLPKLDDPAMHQAGPPDNDSDNAYALRTLSGHHNSVRAIAAHGDTLVSGSYDFTVRVWRISSGELVHRLQGHSAKVYSVVLDHERGRCISGSMDTLVKVWSLDSGMCLFNLEGHTSLVGLLELSHGNLVSAAADSTLRVWDPENGACRGALCAHTGAITCFQHDGQKVISGSDRTLKMWNIQTGECTRDLLTDLTGVWQVRFDERRCVAAVQRNNLTYIEILDFGASRDGVPAEKRGVRKVVDIRGRDITDDENRHLAAQQTAQGQALA